MTGRQLKVYLEHNKVVKQQLAKKMGVSKQLLNCYLGTPNISTVVLEAVADALNTTPEHIYSEMRKKGMLDT